MQIIKKIIWHIFWVLFVFLLSIPFSTNGFFQDKYLCKVAPSWIQVSNKNLNGFYSCIDTIKQLDRSLSEIEFDLELVKEDIKRWNDIEYRKQVESDLLVKQTSISRVRVAIVSEMSAFELSIFSQVKTLAAREFYSVRNSLKIQSDELSNKISAKRTFTNSSFDFEREQLLNINKKLLLIDQMLAAQNFDTFIPIWQLYSAIK